MVNEGVAPENGTPTTEGLRAIPGTGVKTLKGGLSNRASSSLCLRGIGGVGGGALKGTLIVRTCLREGNALGAWGTWDTSTPYGGLAICIAGNGAPAYLGLKTYGILGIGTLIRGGGTCGFNLCLRGSGTVMVTPD